MTLPNFTLSVVLKLPFQTSQQIKRGKMGQETFRTNTSTWHANANLSSLLQIPVPGRSLVQPKHVMHMKQKILGTFLVYLERFRLHQKLSNQWWPSTPPKRNAAGAPFRHPFFFFGAAGSIAPWTCWVCWVFFRPQPLGSDMKVSFFACECQWYICGSFSSDSYGVSTGNTKNLARSWKAPLTEDGKIFRQIFFIFHRPFTWNKSSNSHLSWDFSLCPDVHFLDWL